MRKIAAALVLFICLIGHAIAQELTTEYLKQCNDFLNYGIQIDRYHVNDICIWSLPASASDSLFKDDPDFDSTKPWVCYEMPNCRSAPKNRDTIRLTSKDMISMIKHFNAKHDTAWIHKLASATGLLSDEPPSYYRSHMLLSAPLFLQNNTVCIVKVLMKDSDGDGGGYWVYKKNSQGVWVLIDDVGSYINN